MAACLGRLFGRLFKKRGQKMAASFIRDNASNITISIVEAIQTSKAASSSKHKLENNAAATKKTAPHLRKTQTQRSDIANEDEKITNKNEEISDVK